MLSDRPAEESTVDVSLVIPGYNTQATLGRCLDSVAPLLETGKLREILFVNDGSTDRTEEIARSYPVEILTGPNAGPGAARNLGWRRSHGELVWFMDADCVAEPGALEVLVGRLDKQEVAGAGGTYSNLLTHSWLARLIHAEIAARHQEMPENVDFLASFNVLYRRSALDAVNGFDTARFPASAEDADLAYRLHAEGYRLLFDSRSRVGHHHPTSFPAYLRTQRGHGFWRVQLYAQHPGRSSGDAYSSSLDHLQPPLAMLCLAALPTLAVPAVRWLAPILWTLLFLAQLPMTARLIRQERSFWYASFAPMSFVRAFARGLGMTLGVLALPWQRRKAAARGSE